MKRLFLLGAFCVGLLAFFSCSEENETAIGESLLGAEQLHIQSQEDTNILCETLQDNASDLSQISTALLGTMNDDRFGKMQSSVAFQLRLEGGVSFNKPEVDSVKLFLAYQNFYGKDSISQQNAKVFMLKEPLVYSKKYTAQTDMNSLLGDEVGTVQFNKKMVSDTIFLKSKVDNTKDSLINGKKQYDLINHLTIKLDNEKVGKYILDAPKGTFESTANFLEYFKGLYVKTENTAEEGAIYGFNVYQSFMVLYYKEHIISSKTKKDSVINIYERFPITDNSARFNYPKFDLKNEVVTADDKIYLQGIHGTKAKIELPDLLEWKGKKRLSINKAELIFKVAEDESEIKDYALPNRLELKVIDKDGKVVKLNYSALGGQGIIGLLNPKEKTYTFQIPEFLQRIVEGKRSFSHFEIAVSGVEQRMAARQEIVLYPVDAKNIPSRVVLYSKGEHKPIFKVTYTEY